MTPVGMPRIGTRSPTTSMDVAGGAVAAGEEDQVDAAAERARPPRRACRRRVVTRRPRRRGCSSVRLERTARRRGPRPSRPRAATMLTPVRADARAARAPRRRARPRREPRRAQRARSSDVRPSVPFRPTRPPMPAIGLTISPTRPTSQASLRSSAATSSTACRAIRTISSTSSSVITNGGENEIVSAAGSARVITPSSRQRRVIRAATLRDGSNGVAGILSATNSSAADERRAAHLADERMLVERLVEARLHAARRGSPAWSTQPFVLDQVEVRHRDGGGERMGASRCSRGRTARSAEPVDEDAPHAVGDDAAGEREVAGRQPLRDGDQVGLDPEEVAAEPVRRGGRTR